MEHQISIQDLLCGRTFPEPSAVTKEQTSKPSCKPFAMSRKTGNIPYLNLKEGNGNLLGASWEMVSALPGGYMTPRGGEFHSEGVECTLSQILDLNAPEKYFLSRKACSGILRRAERRGKTLPSMLQDALKEVAGSDG